MRPDALGLATCALLALGCKDGGAPPRSVPEAGAAPSSDAPAAPSHVAPRADTPQAQEMRALMVDRISRDVWDARVRDAMKRVPRHLFVPPGEELGRAYGDHPLPIGEGQTISQPTIVAVMTQALELTGGERVLEIGTGSGYQAAILSLLAREVYSIEIVAPLGERARALLSALGHANVHVRIGDGYKGWPEKAPFDRVIITAAPPEIPRALVDQLAEGGILVAPVGPTGAVQTLKRLRKRGGRVEVEELGAVRFVPMVPGNPR